MSSGVFLERKHRAPATVALFLLVGAIGSTAAVPRLRAQDPASGPVLSPELQRLRSTLDKYQDPIKAVHDGYFSTLGCVYYPSAGKPGHVPYVSGTMGVHFLNPALVSPEPDPLKPQVLIYEPQGDKLRLVAAEWFIPLSTGVKERPRLLGRPFDGPMEGHPPLLPLMIHHYDLHVWLWKENPAGLFSATNPAVKCPKTGYTIAEESPKLVPHPQTQ